MVWLRRTFTIAAWPLIDSFLTIYSNFLLLRYGLQISVWATIVAMTLLNLLLYYLLSKEETIQQWIHTKSQRLLLWAKNSRRLEMGESAFILFVFTVSGPAMAGVPLLWLLGIKGKKAIAFILVGSTINSVLWVGGVYNLFWIVVKEALTGHFLR